MANPIFMGKLYSELLRDKEVFLAREVAPYFGLKDKAAKDIIEQTLEAVSTWREVTVTYSIPRDEVELMAGAFITVL